MQRVARHHAQHEPLTHEMAPQVEAIGSREREVHAAKRQLLHGDDQHRLVAHQQHLPRGELQLQPRTAERAAAAHADRRELCDR